MADMMVPEQPEPESDSETEPEPEMMVPVESELEPETTDPIREVVESYTCVDEREQALAYTSIPGYQTSIPELWDGTPFIVDVSSTFPNAHELLNVVEEEATIIHAALGYEIFVAGDVLPLADLAAPQLAHDQHIEIRCCDDNAGTAFPWWRLILLTVDGEMQARHNIVHELYHILGFVHSDETEGVMMSYPLDFALEFPIDEGGNIVGEWYFYTLSTPDDLAKLACIYD